MDGADLHNATLSGADLTNARLNSARLENTCFHDANLTRADLRDSIINLPATKIIKDWKDRQQATREEGTSFSGYNINLEGANFDQVTNTFTGQNQILNFHSLAARVIHPKRLLKNIGGEIGRGERQKRLWRRIALSAAILTALIYLLSSTLS